MINTLESESSVAIKWFKNNDMFANPDKFQAIIVNNKKKIRDNYILNINDTENVTTDSVKLLGIEIDNELNFNNHVTTICKKASNQLNALESLQNFLGKIEKEIMLNSFIYSNFNYCPLVWHFCSKKSTNKIEKIQVRCLRMLSGDYNSNYEKLLSKLNDVTMETKRHQSLAIEIFKTRENLNLSFMKDIFSYSPYPTHKNENLFIQERKTVRFGENSLKSLGPQIWNSIPDTIRSTKVLSVFKKLIKEWVGMECKCNTCSFMKRDFCNFLHTSYQEMHCK